MRTPPGVPMTLNVVRSPTAGRGVMVTPIPCSAPVPERLPADSETLALVGVRSPAALRLPRPEVSIVAAARSTPATTAAADPREDRAPVGLRLPLPEMLPEPVTASSTVTANPALRESPRIAVPWVTKR